jgi:hypothetical protein
MYKNIIVIAGVPRSGTSWLGEIIDSSPHVTYRFQPLFSYAFKDAVNMDSPKEEYLSFFKGIYESNDSFLLQTDKREVGLYPYFDKSADPEHLAFKTCRYQYLLPKMLQLFDNIKLLGIIRNPCATINSWLKNPKEFPEGADPRKEWRLGACKNTGRWEEFFGYFKWKEVSNLYLDLEEKYPDRTIVIQYEDLVEDTMAVVERIFDFLGLTMTKQTRNFIKKCHLINIDSPYSVFKNKAVKDKWKEELDPHIRDEIMEDLKGTRLERFLR